MWRPFDRWALEGSYTYVKLEIHGDILHSDEGDAPHHQAKVFSFLNVPPEVFSFLKIAPEIELNTGLYYVDNVLTNDVPSYVRLDQGITWHATKNIDLIVWGQNLLEKTHREASSIEVERSFYAEVQFAF